MIRGGSEGRANLATLVWLSLVVLLLALGGYWLIGGETDGQADLVDQDNRLSELNSTRQATGTATADVDSESSSDADGSSRSRKRSIVPTPAKHSVPRLKLRLFLGAGQPLTQGSVVCRIVLPDQQLLAFRDAYLVMDGSNEVEVEVSNLPDPCPTVQVLLTHIRSRPGRNDQAWRVAMDIPGPEPGKEWIAPPCVLTTEKQMLLCKGTVLDDRGQPVPGCIVTWGVQQIWRPKVGRLGDMAEFPSPSVPQPGIDFRRNRSGEPSVSFEPAPDGSFEIWGMVGMGIRQLHLSAWAPGFLRVSNQQVPVGERNARIVLVKAGSLEGSLELSYGVEIRNLVMALFRPDAKPSGSKWTGKAPPEPVIEAQPKWLKGKARFVMQPIPPGRYDLHLGYLSPYETLVVVPGIDIVAGTVSRDVRVQGLDLKNLLGRIHVIVRSEKGQGLRSARIRYGIQNRIEGWLSAYAIVDDQGHAMLTIPTSGVDLRIQLQGYEERRFPKVQRDLTVTLAPDRRPKVEVRIGAGLTEQTGRRVRMQLQLISDAEVPGGDRKPQLPKPILSRSYSLTGRFYFRKVTPGKYRVSLRVTHAGNRHANFAVEGDGIYSVQAGSKKQILNVAVDWVRLKKLLATGRAQ